MSTTVHYTDVPAEGRDYGPYTSMWKSSGDNVPWAVFVRTDIAPSDWRYIQMEAGGGIMAGADSNPNSGSFQSIADPLVIVQPSWEFAGRYDVIQPAGLADAALIEMTRSLEAPLAPGNHAPTADAWPDENATVGTAYQLNGAASSDQDGDQLTYQWNLSAYTEPD
jgi:hypothetical protein